MDSFSVAVQANDGILRAGLISLLASRSAEIVTERPEVLIVAARKWTAEIETILFRSAGDGGPPVLLMIDEIGADQLAVAVDHRVVGILSRESTTADQLMQSVRTAARGGGVLSERLVGSVLRHVGDLRRELFAARGLTETGLSPREIDVLRLIADGHDTGEIARKLGLSERTVKSDIYQVMDRLGLRNRTQVIAYAVRAGAI